MSKTKTNVKIKKKKNSQNKNIIKIEMAKQIKIQKMHICLVFFKWQRTCKNVNKKKLRR